VPYGMSLLVSGFSRTAPLSSLPLYFPMPWLHRGNDLLDTCHRHFPSPVRADSAISLVRRSMKQNLRSIIVLKQCFRASVIISDRQMDWRDITNWHIP
jgi:hypothetical protein